MITPKTSRVSSQSVTLVVEQLRRRVPGGIGTYARELVRALSRIGTSGGAEISLYASRLYGREDPLATLGFPLRRGVLPGPLMTRMWDHGLGAFNLGAGLVHALSLAAPPTHDPLIVTVHDLTFRDFPETFTRSGREWHERALVRCAARAERFVVPSEIVADQLVGAGLGIGRSQVRVITEGADHLGARDDPRAEALLDSIGVTGRFILSVGTIEPRKNLRRLIAAFAAARPELDGCSLVICGPTGWLPDLDADGIGGAEDVHFIGHVPDGVLASLYSRATVVAYVPLSEGFGLPVVEAMFHGAVVVASAVPSAGPGSHIVDPIDVASIAAGLVRCCEDDELRKMLRHETRAYIGDLTWEKTARAHLALWSEVLGT